MFHLSVAKLGVGQGRGRGGYEKGNGVGRLGNGKGWFRMKDSLDS